MRQRGIALTLLLVGGMALAGCGSAASPSPSASESTAPSESAAAAGECPTAAQGQSIEMWSPLTGPDGQFMTELAAKFTSENSMGITVTHVPQPDYVQKLNAAAAANQLPAATVVRVINVGELAARNVLKPYTGEGLALVDSLGADEPENAWVRGVYKDQRYSVPLDIHPLVMYYNKDMFKAAGLADPGSTPLTGAEFTAALDKLVASGVSKPIAIGNAFNGATLFQTLIRQFGGELATDDGKTVTFNSEAGVKALTALNDLRKKYSDDIAGAGDPEVGAFKQGQAAIVIHGPWHISDLQKLPFVGFAPVPQWGDQYAVWAGSHQVGITTADPAKQAAVACWVKWLSDNSIDWAKAGQVPTRNSIRADANLATVAAPIAAVAPVVDKAIILPQVPEIEGALWGQFGPVVDAVFAGEATDIKKALDDAAAASQQIVDENAQKYAN